MFQTSFCHILDANKLSLVIVSVPAADACPFPTSAAEHLVNVGHGGNKHVIHTSTLTADRHFCALSTPAPGDAAQPL